MFTSWVCWIGKPYCPMRTFNKIRMYEYDKRTTLGGWEFSEFTQLKLFNAQVTGNATTWRE